MSGFKSFMYNGSPIIDSFVDIASINLPSSDSDINSYKGNQYNLLANTTYDLQTGYNYGYVLTTNNNIISIDSSGCGFCINNIGIYKISLCFSFDSANSAEESNTIYADVMLNGSPLTSVTDIVAVNSILDVNASGTTLSFSNSTNKSISSELSDKSISDNVDSNWGASSGGTVSDGTAGNTNSFCFFNNPTILYCSTSFQQDSSTASDPPFVFARYCLSTNNSGRIIPNPLCFTAIVNITSTSNQSNFFYPCICPYHSNASVLLWNSGNNNLPKPYLVVQMISALPVSA